MSFLNGIVPARFLTLMSHLLVLITAFWGKHENVIHCLPVLYTTSEYDAKNYELTIGLIMSIALIGMELISFLGGVSLFWPFVSLLSILAHCTGSVCMGFFLLREWECNTFWLIFVFSNVMPAFGEILTICGVVILKK